MAFDLSVNRLVLLVLFAVTLAFVLLLGIFLNASAGDAGDSSCMTSVLARAGVVEFAGAASGRGGADLIGCEPRVRNLTGESERSVERTITDDLLWCQRSFGQDAKLVSTDETTFCHPCAFYYDEEGGLTTAPGEAISAALEVDADISDIYEEFTGGGEEVEGLPEVHYDFSAPLAIVFVQTNDETLMSQLLGSPGSGAVAGFFTGAGAGLAGAGGAALLGVAAASNPVGWLVTGGAVIGAGTGWVAGWFLEGGGETLSTIVIRPYVAEELDALGCTTVDLAVQGQARNGD